MKKLTKLHLKSARVLNVSEMKRICGGFDVTSGTCAVLIPDTNGDWPSFGNLDGQSGTYTSDEIRVDTTSGYTIHVGISYSSAMSMIAGVEGAKWCCDSCDGASWL